MAQTLGSLIVQMGMDLRNFERGRSEFERGLDAIGRKATSVGNALSLGITLPILGVGTAVLKAASDLDALRRGMVTVTGSVDKARETMAALEEVAKLPGLGFKEALQGSINLQAAGFSAKLAERALIGFGNALATVGRGKAELDGVIRALSQIKSKGVISAEEINQLAERVPQIRQIMMEAFGTASTEALQAAGLGVDEFVERVIGSLEKLPKATGGVKNSFENLSDSMLRAADAIGQQLIPAIIPLVDGLVRMLEGVRALDPNTVRWAIALGAVAAAAGPVIAAIGTLTTVAGAFAAMIGTTLLPVVAVGAPVLVGLAALSALFVKSKLDALDAAGAVDRFKASLVGISEATAKGLLGDRLAQGSALSAQIRKQEEEIERTRGRVLSGDTHLGPRLAGQRKALEELRAQSAGVNEEIRALTRTISDMRTSGLQPTTTATDEMGKRAAELAERLKAAKAQADAYRDSMEKLANAPMPTLGLSGSENVIRIGGIEIDPAEAARFREDLRKKAEVTAQLDLRIKDISQRDIPPVLEVQRTFVDRVAGTLSDLIQPLTYFARAVEDAGGTLALIGQTGAQRLDRELFGLADVLGGFTPLGIIAEALGGALSVLAPALNALLVPVRIVGEAFGRALLPVLQAIFPVFRFLGIAATYVGEILFRVADGIATAIGSVIYALGVILDKVPFLGDFGLRKLGNQFKTMFDGAVDGMKDAREALSGLTWEEAIGGVDALGEAATKTAEALSNVPEIFEFALRRRQSALGQGLTSTNASGLLTPRGLGSTAGVAVAPNGPTYVVNIHNPPSGMDARGLERSLTDTLNAPGTNQLKLAVQKVASAAVAA